MFKQHDVRLCGFRWSILILIDYVWISSIDRSISTPSCSYCIWNIYGQNRRSFLLNVLLFAWFDTVEFNRLPFSNNKKYNDVVFGDRFIYQLTMFKLCILIGLSRLVDTHIAYKIAIQKSRLVTGLMRETISHAGLWWNASLDGDNRFMDGHRECDGIRNSREIFDLYSHIYY